MIFMTALTIALFFTGFAHSESGLLRAKKVLLGNTVGSLAAHLFPLDCGLKRQIRLAIIRRQLSTFIRQLAIAKIRLGHVMPFH